ncbi:MAG TPA: inositol monophosphatase family protein, partial [Opitutales bacterium]|nr:inositol monophosphatase family protein [Opitutales bacterium]
MTPVIDLKTVAIAEQAARLAGDILRQKPDNYRTVKFEDQFDVKLEADMESEKLIRNYFQAHAPYAIIGEEEGGDTHLYEGNEPYWVVDPLDGTYNYTRDWPITCVSIGLMIGKEPVVGVIYDFNTDTMYSALVGDKLRVNSKPWDTRWAGSAAQACLLTGMSAGRDMSPEAISKFIKNVLHFKKVRMLGSAAMSLVYVALGYADVYL